MRENVLEHVVTTPLPVRMPLQATGQSEKLIVQPCWRAILAQQPLMAAAVSPPGCAILTHRLCYRAAFVRMSVQAQRHAALPCIG